ELLLSVQLKISKCLRSCAAAEAVELLAVNANDIAEIAPLQPRMAWKTSCSPGRSVRSETDTNRITIVVSLSLMVAMKRRMSSQNWMMYTCHSNRSIKRTRMRSRVWGSKKISVGLYVPLLGWVNPCVQKTEHLSAAFGSVAPKTPSTT